MLLEVYYIHLKILFFNGNIKGLSILITLFYTILLAKKQPSVPSGSGLQISSVSGGTDISDVLNKDKQQKVTDISDVLNQDS